MLTRKFVQSIDELFRLANQDQIVFMYADAILRRGHRSLIADRLLAGGIRFEHIMSATHPQVPTLTPFAKVQGTTITYPSESSVGMQKNPSAKRSRSQPG